MSHRLFSFFVVFLLTSAASFGQDASEPARILRAGMIGLDTSHVIAFTRIFNDPDAKGPLAGIEVVAGYPGGTDIPASRDRVGRFTQQLREMGVEIVDDIPQLLAKVDVVLLESVDGRIHLEEAAPVIRAGKPLYIDKPVAGSLADAVAIYQLAEKHGVPCFSSSSTRFSDAFQGLLNNEQVGDIAGCATWGPCSYQTDIPDMFFYGVHGIEALFTIMGPGCISVSRATTEDTDLITGIWDGGRVGTYRGIRKNKASFGATAFGSRGIVSVTSGGAYQQLCTQIAMFFQTHQPPVAPQETVKIFAFMEAADVSKARGGGTVRLQELIEQATKTARQRIGEISQP